MSLIPLRNSDGRRSWFITHSLTCLLLFGACVMLLFSTASHRIAHAALTTPTLPACAPTPTITPISGPYEWVTITAPACGATFTLPATITISANASIMPSTAGTITKADFSFSLQDSSEPATLIGTVTTPPYQIAWRPPAGISGIINLEAQITVYANTPLGGTNRASTPIQLTSSNTGTPTLIPTTPTPPPGPTVTITSPANGAEFTMPTTITIAATVSPYMGTPITKVDFSYSTANAQIILIGTVTAPPYQITWRPPAGMSGLVILSALATDSLGRESQWADTDIQFVNPTPVSGSCAVHYQLNSQWSGGFSTNVTITNTGSTPFNGWTLQFTFPGDQRITQFWNGNVTQSGETVSITNLAYNGSIASGGSVYLGFNGMWTSNDSAPPSFSLNGMACTTS